MLLLKYISCCLLQVACSWAPHGMAAQPYMAATHMKISFLTPTGPWDISGSVSYAETEIHPDPQYFAAQQASIERCVLGKYWITSFSITQYILVCHTVTMQSQCTTDRLANIQLMVKLSQHQIHQTSIAEKRYK